MKKNLFTVLLLFTLASCAQQKQSDGGGLLEATDYEKLLNETTDKQVIDVRTHEEFASGNISGAMLLNFYDSTFTYQLSMLDKNKPVFVYCQGGGRSGQAAETLKELGFKIVYDLKGGMMSWMNAGKKVEAAVTTGAASVSKLPNHIYTKEDFNLAINDSLPVLIDFYAKWCQPCKHMSPALEKLADEYKGKLRIMKIDIVAARELSAHLRIESIPVIDLYFKGKQMTRTTGFQSEEQLRTIINGTLKN